MKDLAPIVLFVYNRPQHTLQCLKSLQANALSQHSRLFIFSDGIPLHADKDTRQHVAEVREVICQKRWCGKVSITTFSENKGLAENIITGVTKIIQEFGKVIVLEDDLVLSPGFLQYMNEALDFYQNETKVMHINGYMYPLNIRLPETFFYQVSSPWGWATWERAWNKLDIDVERLYQRLKTQDLLYKFNLDGVRNFSVQLVDNIHGTLDTWAVRWYASIFFNDGLCLTPAQSLIQNIGFDDSGMHCKKTDTFYVPHLANNTKINSIPMEQNLLVRKKMKVFYQYGGTTRQHKYLYWFNYLKGNMYKHIPTIVKKFYRKFKYFNFEL